MNLYLMRHANAGVARGNYELDAKRALIKEGKEQCMLMAQALSALKVQVDVIVASPLKRAMQTAQFVATEMGIETPIEVNAALSLDADYASFQKMLTEYAEKGYEGVLAVGHNPNMFQFLGRMITGNGGAAVRMRKASVARVDLAHRPPILRWLLDARMARLLLTTSTKYGKQKSTRK
jgi:phosphohistidine phosphatase